MVPAHKFVFEARSKYWGVENLDSIASLGKAVLKQTYHKHGNYGAFKICTRWTCNMFEVYNYGHVYFFWHHL